MVDALVLIGNDCSTIIKVAALSFQLNLLLRFTDLDDGIFSFVAFTTEISADCNQYIPGSSREDPVRNKCCKLKALKHFLSQ